MSEKDRPDPDGTEMVDLGDADVSAVDIPPSSRTGATHERSLPPPLPPEVRASSPPMQEIAHPGSKAQPPPTAHVSVVPPPPRSNRFYVMIVVGVLALGVIGGIAVAMSTRGEKKPTVTVVPGTSSPTSASASPAGSVMTLPTIDMNDDDDAGK